MKVKASIYEWSTEYGEHLYSVAIVEGEDGFLEEIPVNLVKILE